jgi:hypothetical protein
VLGGNRKKKQREYNVKLITKKKNREEEERRLRIMLEEDEAFERERERERRKKEKKEMKKSKHAMSKSMPVGGGRPEVDEDETYASYGDSSYDNLPPLQAMSRSGGNNAARNNSNPSAASRNPYGYNVRPGKYNVPSYAAPSAAAPSANALKLNSLKERQSKYRDEFKKEESNKAELVAIRRKEDARASQKRFQTVEEARLYNNRQKLARQGEQLLAPIKQQQLSPQQLRGRRQQHQHQTKQEALEEQQRMEETFLLLDCMDDLLLQISILKARLEELQENTESEGERAENTELLDCLAATSGHIHKHKEMLENGEMSPTKHKHSKSKKLPSHMSILNSAQTWKITLLTVVDTLALRQRDEAIDEEVGGMDFDAMEMEREMKERKEKKQGVKAKASASVIDGIEDSKTRQKLLLKLGNGTLDVGEVVRGGGLSPSKMGGGSGGGLFPGGDSSSNDTTREEAINRHKMLRLVESSSHASPGRESDMGSPLPGLSELGLL